MIHHLSLGVADLDRAAAFYDAALAPLGYRRVWSHAIADGYQEAAVGYGPVGGDDVLALRWRPTGVPPSSDAFHVAFNAPSREAVRDFHRAALAHGGTDNGGAGLHPEYGPGYFAAFVIDPDGHRLEALRLERD
jgi:catechol 2,3-dioxygenase-like lactoylglutathione lyase family enzyme